MDFPDEVDTPFKDARKRFIKYRGIKSLRNCDWDPYENLPAEYSKIWRFQNLQAEVKQQKDIVLAEGLPIHGTFITLVLSVDNDHTFTELDQSRPIILSTLFPHECKISTMHFKLSRTLENKEIVPSKSTMEFNCGFRRIIVRPSFSMELTNTGKADKLKYMKFLRGDMSVIATAYMPFVYQPCKMICFTKREGQPVNMDVVATGIALQPDPLKILLKRVILTGYPLRCHKKKATIRYMFFDPKDIKYFRPVELYTKNGLRVSLFFLLIVLQGHIKDSLGTHGLMKCHFNDHIKQHDIVCMPLYKRIYPQWYEKTWNPLAEEPVKKTKVTFEAEEKMEAE